MIVTMDDGERRRFPQFQVWRRRGKRPTRYYLMLLQWSSWYHIPFAHNGDLAMSGPHPRDCYEVSFNRLSADVQVDVQRCIRWILDKGTPLERDEHVFSDAYRR